MTGPCVVDGCDRLAQYRTGYCSTHQHRWKKYGNPLVLTRHFVKGRICKVQQCRKPVYVNDFCREHDRRNKLYGNPLTVLQAPAGNGHKSRSGYIQVQVNGRKTNLHVLVAEKKIGRKLRKKEVVHHINGDRSDNSPENLQVLKNSKEHNILHRKQTAFAACGHEEWRRCNFCKGYDDPNNLIFTGQSNVYHRECRNKSRRKHNGKNGKSFTQRTRTRSE